MVFIWHPDKHQANEQARLIAEEECKKINQAYEIVCEAISNGSFYESRYETDPPKEDTEDDLGVSEEDIRRARESYYKKYRKKKISNKGKLKILCLCVYATVLIPVLLSGLAIRSFTIYTLFSGKYALDKFADTLFCPLFLLLVYLLPVLSHFVLCFTKINEIRNNRQSYTSFSLASSFYNLKSVLKSVFGKIRK